MGLVTVTAVLCACNHSSSVLCVQYAVLHSDVSSRLQMRWWFRSASYFPVLLLLLLSYRLPLCPLPKTLLAQEVGGAEPQVKTPMRSGASSWSVTGLQLLAVGRRGKCGSSPWRRRLRTSTP